MPQLYRSDFAFRFCVPILHSDFAFIKQIFRSFFIVVIVKHSDRKAASMDLQSEDQKEQQRQQLRQAALEYHECPTPGKISVTPTKQLTNQRDLALAYSPGVA